METGEAVIEALYNRITQDTTLQGVLGSTILLYRVNAPQDPTMPYLVHRFEWGELFVGTHTYFLDLWDYAETPVRIDNAVDRIKVLLHQWTITADEIGAGVMRWFSGGHVPTDTPKVYHYATQWEITFGNKQDIENIVG